MTATGALELLGVDHLLSDEEKAIQETVRRFAAEKVRPYVADWYEAGDIPLSPVDAGKLGLLGMHLSGYGCAGTNAVSYGLACMEPEAADLAQPGLCPGLAGHVRDLEVRPRGTEAALASRDGGR